MYLHFSGTLSQVEFEDNEYAKNLIELNNNPSVMCQFYDEHTSVHEPCLWILVNNRYDTGILKNATLQKGTPQEENFVKLYKALLETLYNKGFSNGDFRL